MLPCSPTVDAHVRPWEMINNQRPPRGDTTYENVLPLRGRPRLIVGNLLIEISNHCSASGAQLSTRRTSAPAAWAGEVDGGMLRDAGVIGRRLTTAENAFDSAEL